MSILYILLVLLVAGLILYLIERFIPLDPTVKWIIRVVVIIVIIVWLLKVAGIWGAMGNIKV